MLILAILILVGVVSFVLLGEIRRTGRALEERIEAHHRAIGKISELEAQVRVLSKKVEVLTR